jgi:tetratricopeptide (TPR) repeat protein
LDPARAPAASTSTRTPSSFNNEGLILGEIQRLDEAERAFLAALAIEPEYQPARINLAELLVARARQRGGAAAIDALTRAIALHDGDTPRLMRGRYRLEANDCRGALRDFQAIRAPTALSWASMAAAHGCLGHDPEARDAVQRSLALDPDQPRLRELLRNGS